MPLFKFPSLYIYTPCLFTNKCSVLLSLAEPLSKSSFQVLQINVFATICFWFLFFIGADFTNVFRCLSRIKVHSSADCETYVIHIYRVFSRIPLLEDKYLKTKEMHLLFALLNVGTCDVTHQHGRHDVT